MISPPMAVPSHAARLKVSSSPPNQPDSDQRDDHQEPTQQVGMLGQAVSPQGGHAVDRDDAGPRPLRPHDDFAEIAQPQRPLEQKLGRSDDGLDSPGGEQAPGQRAACFRQGSYHQEDRQQQPQPGRLIESQAPQRRPEGRGRSQQRQHDQGHDQPARQPADSPRERGQQPRADGDERWDVAQVEEAIAQLEEDLLWPGVPQHEIAPGGQHQRQRGQRTGRQQGCLILKPGKEPRAAATVGHISRTPDRAVIRPGRRSPPPGAPPGG